MSGTRQTLILPSVRFLPRAFCEALGKCKLCRVLDIMHSAKSLALGIRVVSGSVDWVVVRWCLFLSPGFIIRRGPGQHALPENGNFMTVRYFREGAPKPAMKKYFRGGVPYTVTKMY